MANQMFNFLIQADNAESVERDVAGRILTAEYQLGINMHNRQGQQLASDALGQLVGKALGRIFQ